MKKLQCNTPSGFAIFCDDVRFENTGKQIYIGVYTNEMVFSGELPTALRSLSVVINFIVRPNDIPDQIKFAVTFSGIEAPLAELTASADDLKKFPIPPREEGDTDPYDPIMQFSIVLNIHDIVLPDVGKFRVRAFYGEEEYRVGALKVRKMTEKDVHPYSFMQKASSEVAT